jgi:hypothetical protein
MPLFAEFILAMSAAVIKEFGFVSRAYAAKFEEATPRRRHRAAFGNKFSSMSGMPPRKGFVRIEMTDADIETASAPPTSVATSTRPATTATTSRKSSRTTS